MPEAIVECDECPWMASYTDSPFRTGEARAHNAFFSHKAAIHGYRRQISKTEYYRSYRAKYRAEAIVQGKCPNCLKRPCASGNICCSECLEHKRQNSRFRRRKSNAECRLCAICSSPITQRTAHLDHCHRTNKVREYLCRPCNFGLGHFKDNSELLRKAAAYLEAHAVDMPVENAGQVVHI